MAIEIQHGLHHVRIHDICRSLDGRRHRANRSGRLLQQRCDRSVNRGWIQKRLVTLHVREDVAFFMRGHFRHALGSRAMIGARHARFAAERFNRFHDALVVRRYKNAVHSRSRFRPLVDALNHRFPRKRHERFPRQARGRISRRNHHNHFCRPHFVASPIAGISLSAPPSHLR